MQVRFLLARPHQIGSMNRLPHYAETLEEVLQYYQTRAYQLTLNSVIWDGPSSLILTPEGAYTSFTDSRLSEKYISVYTFADMRGKGLTEKLIATAKRNLGDLPIVTVAGCNIREYLSHKQYEYVLCTAVYDSPEYKLIESVYGDSKTKRSGAFLMNHIDEGLIVMQRHGASEQAMKAFCLHPLVQGDDYCTRYTDVVAKTTTPYIVALAFEYRNKANAWLSDKVSVRDNMIVSDGSPSLSPLKDVNDMLIGDKVQNLKDFEQYHLGTHPRSVELSVYFSAWINELGVTSYQDERQFLKSIDWIKPKCL
jgi:hypothetical protein